MTLAPIVLFTYNRPEHTKKTLDALAMNAEALSSILHIYCDGPKSNASAETLKAIEAVQALAHSETRFKEVIVYVSQVNKGLANSIKTGVTHIVNTYGRVIVLEDDLVTSKGFLSYMNAALALYENEPRVMHISGYMYPHNKSLPETFFFDVPLCWGWATWKRSWDCYEDDALVLWHALKQTEQMPAFDKFGGTYLSSQLAANITGDLNTWFVKWHASVFLKKGHTLYPRTSLVNNIGFDSTGEHNGTFTQFNHTNLASTIQVQLITIKEHEEAINIIQGFYKALVPELVSKKRSYLSIVSLKKALKRRVRSLFFKFFPDLKQGQEPQSHIEQCYLGKCVKIYPKSYVFNSVIGQYSYIAKNASISNTTIGKFCSIGPYFNSGWGLHPTHGISTHPMFYSNKKQNGISLSVENKIKEKKPITIGNDVFIGMHVIVLDGVTIGDGAVIGAGAVVSKDIPPYAIAVGNPIKIIKYRFEHQIIDKLLHKRWWNNPDDLQLVEKYFFDVESYLETIK